MSEVGQAELVTSKRQAAAVCNVMPIVVRRWIAREWLAEPPWTLQQLRDVRDHTDPDGRLRGPGAALGTETRWTQGCNCDLCCTVKTDAVRGNGRRTAHKRLPVEIRQQLLDAISAGKQFRATVRDLGLTTNQVWGLTKPDQHWAVALEAALMASRRDDLKNGTNAAYVHGCVSASVGAISASGWTTARRASRKMPTNTTARATHEMPSSSVRDSCARDSPMTIAMRWSASWRRP